MRENRSLPAIKICGLTDPEQALKIAAMGVDAIGVIGVEGTPRFVDNNRRRQLFDSLHRQQPTLKRVWVVAEAEDHQLSAALEGVGRPSVIQLHGSESPERCRILRERHPQVRWWKALRLRSSEDLKLVSAYSTCVDALLLDAWSPDQLGGTGHRLPLDWLGTASLPLPWWLAGGISAEWIPDLLNAVHPDGLDASSRLETSPGRKDLDRVRNLIHAVRHHRSAHPQT